jgi:hypothetical protein
MTILAVLDGAAGRRVRSSIREVRADEICWGIRYSAEALGVVHDLRIAHAVELPDRDWRWK